MQRVSTVIRSLLCVLAVMMAFLFGASTSVPNVGAMTSSPGNTVTLGIEPIPPMVLLPGDRVLQGTVEQVLGEMIRVNTGEVEPRFLPIKEAIEKGIPSLKKGDRLEIAVNDQNLVIDYHLLGQPSWYRIVKGQLAQPLPVGHGWAIIRSEDGTEQTYEIRPLARSKVAAIPLHAQAVFLIDQSNKLIDATFGSDQTIRQAAAAWRKSPPKAAYQRIEATIVKPTNWISVRTARGEEKSYEVRPFVQEKLKQVRPGEQVILLLDNENKVGDIAIPSRSSRG
jgi:TusA-related sulfurtransferase